jgi:hypothetical protein
MNWTKIGVGCGTEYRVCYIVVGDTCFSNDGILCPSLAIQGLVERYTLSVIDEDSVRFCCQMIV